jgi:hypothetical protein
MHKRPRGKYTKTDLKRIPSRTEQTTGVKACIKGENKGQHTMRSPVGTLDLVLTYFLLAPIQVVELTLV